MPEAAPQPASDLFAISQGSINDGGELCHWCGAKCTRQWRHDDLSPIPFVKPKNLARHPGMPFICIGCWLWRRKRVQIAYLDEREKKDGQCAMNHSWWITEEGAWAIRPEDYSQLYSLLLSPPTVFALSLISDKSTHNQLHLNFYNDELVIRQDTRLLFTFDNIVMSYSIYELEMGLKEGATGKEPGVQALIRMLGRYDNLGKEEAEKKGPGRPPALDDAKSLKKRK